MQLLDWTQDFDKLHSQAVTQALTRHGVMPAFVDLVEAIVPAVAAPRQNQPFFDLAYADDTAIFTGTAERGSHSARSNGSRPLATPKFSQITPMQRPSAMKEYAPWRTSPPLTHHIHRAQLKLFGHVLRATPSNLGRNCVFMEAFVYRGGSVKSGIRPGRRRVHWVEQCAELAWHWLSHTPQALPTEHPTFAAAFLQVHRLAVNRPVWNKLVGLPTCRSTSFFPTHSEIGSRV